MTAYLSFGVIAFVFGFMIYYLLPREMLSYNLDNIARIFMLILIGLVGGLCLLAFNLQVLMEALVLKVYMYFEPQYLKLMVRANLKNHRGDNKLTAMVYSIALGSVIFLVVGYSLALKALQQYHL